MHRKYLPRVPKPCGLATSLRDFSRKSKKSVAHSFFETCISVLSALNMHLVMSAIFSQNSFLDPKGLQVPDSLISRQQFGLICMILADISITYL